MAAISASDVKALRDQTGAGMMDCKRALSEAEGDVKRAVDLLRERGLAKAGKREGRATSEGGIAISVSGSLAAMVEVGSETDFVARTDMFGELVDTLAQTVASSASIDGVETLLLFLALFQLFFASLASFAVNAPQNGDRPPFLSRARRIRRPLRTSPRRSRPGRPAGCCGPG